MRYAVIIPVYNEKDLFPVLLERVLNAPLPRGPRGDVERLVVVVDDGSTDGTRELVAAMTDRPGVVAVLHERNTGKGAAVRTGFARALQAGADILLIQDADLEYDPAEHGVVVAPILDGRADAVFGSRFLGDTHRVLYFWHAVANRVITTLSNMLTNLNLTDIECCFKAFTREVAERLTIEEDRFGLEPELVAKVAKMVLPCAGGGAARRPGAGGGVASDRGKEGATGAARARVYEVGVSYAGRTYDEGKKITWKDGVSALRCILKYRFL